MGNTCSRKGQNNTAMTRSNLPNQNLQNAVVTPGIIRTAQNVRHGGKPTMVIPTNMNYRAGAQGPTSALTNYINPNNPQMSFNTINNVVGDPYLNASYVKVTDYGSMNGIRTTDAAYPAYGQPDIIVNKTTHTTIIDVPANNNTYNNTYSTPMYNAPVVNTPMPLGVTGVRDRDRVRSRSRSSSSQRRRASGDVSGRYIQNNGNATTQVYNNGNTQTIVTTQVTPIQSSGLRY